MKGKILSNLTLDELNKLVAESNVQIYYLRDVIAILLSLKDLTVQKLIQISRLPRSLIIKILKKLKPFLYEPSEYIKVREEAIEIFRQYLNEIQLDYTQKYDWIKLGNNIEEISSFLKNTLIKRPPPKRSLDQFDATLETLLRRISFLEMEGVLSGSRILFLGDYDLTSLAVALKRMPNEIHVVDIDQELLTLIQNIADEYSFPVITHQQDLRLGLPKELTSSFNIVFTDPPFTINGARLFLTHAINALSSGGIIYCCFGYTPNNLIMGSQFQELFNELGLVARTILENFNVYSKAQSIGSTSHLFKLLLAKKNKIIPLKITGSIYSGYRENENLVEVIRPSIRYKLIEESLIDQLLHEISTGFPTSIAFINPSFGPLQNRLMEQGILIKCIELEGMDDSITYQKNIKNLEMLYPPPLPSKASYQKLIIESPCFDLNSVIEWIRFKICKNVYLVLPEQFQNIELKSKMIKITLFTKLLLSILWTWDAVLTIPPEAFEPHFFQTTYLYKGTPLPKKLLLPDSNKYILRELIEQSTKKVANALRESIIRFNEKIDKKITKKQSIELVDKLELPINILNLQVQQLSDSELNLIMKKLLEKFKIN